MHNLKVNIEKNPYEILIGTNAISMGADKIKEIINPKEKVIVISDKNVWSIYGTAFNAVIKNINDGIAPATIVLKPGESTKTLDNLNKIFDGFGKLGVSRGGVIIAVGGGVIGDISGFAAACWMRGIKFIQIPTSLLAMVDSSVGGKTAVDIPAGKNLVGAFHQPSLVVVDPLFLRTLPEREFKTGMAELIKSAAIQSPALFEKLETFDATEDMTRIIMASIHIKKRLVEEDEFEKNVRKILNFGHTFGHAIEVKSEYSVYTHGEAVAAGMLIAAKLGVSMGITNPLAMARLEQLLRKFNLDINYDAYGLLDHIKKDKKVVGAGIDFIFIKEIGHSVIRRMSFAELENCVLNMEKNLV